MTKFQTVTMVNTEGHSVTGDFVCETSNAWHVGINGKVQLLKKDEWTSAPAGAPDLNDLRGTMFGGQK